MINKKNSRLSFLVLFFVCLFLFYMVPYSHDEWAWGTETGLNNFRNFFQGYNGRYFGDVISLLITRSNIVKAVFMASTFVVLVWSIVKYFRIITRNKIGNNTIFCIALVLVLLVPKILFQQTYGWPAAFVNFVPPVIFIVNIFSAIETDILQGNNKRTSMFKGILLTLGTQFFSENITIYMVLFSIYLLILDYRRSRVITKFNFGVFISSFVGAIIMFINPAYFNAVDGSDGYKKIVWSIDFLWNKIAIEMIPNIFLNYKFLNLLVLLLVFLYFTLHKSSQNWMSFVAILVIVGYTIYSVFFYPDITLSYSFDNLFIIFFSLLYYISLIIFIVKNFVSVKRERYLYLLLSIPLSSGPLLIANPIGARSFYIVYVLWSLFIILLCFDTIIDLVGNQFIVMQLVKHLSFSVSVITLIFYLLIFFYSYRTQIQRQEIIEQSVDAESSTIVLPELPNREYVWKTSIDDPVWIERFKDFYDVPSDKDVIFREVE